MTYNVDFPTEKIKKIFKQNLLKIPNTKLQNKIMDEVEQLAKS